MHYQNKSDNLTIKITNRAILETSFHLSLIDSSVSIVFKCHCLFKSKKKIKNKFLNLDSGKRLLRVKNVRPKFYLIVYLCFFSKSKNADELRHELILVLYF